MSMSELTHELGGMVLGRESTLDVDGSNSHLLDHIPIEAPLPTCHLQPCLTILCAAIILLHAKDGQDPSSTLRKSISGK